MLLFKDFLSNFFKTNILFFLLLSCLPPSYANVSKVKLTCNVETSGLRGNKEWKWVSKKMNWDVEIDFVNETLIKKNYFYVNNQTRLIKTDFNIQSVTKNGLVAVSKELTEQFVGTPNVSTITLDNFLFEESNSPVGVTYANHGQSFGEHNFAIHYGECK